MPYIKPELRESLTPRVGMPIKSQGELNFVLSEVCKIFLQDNQPNDYSVLGQVTGALNDCKTEFERRKMAPLEDEAIKRNGDIY